jgi:hypothetical protein
MTRAPRDYNYLFRLLLGAGCSVAEADALARASAR